MAMAIKKKITTKILEQKFEDTAFRMIQEKSDFLLPQIQDFISTKKWINLRPEYQRRSVWDNKKRSLFIESLLLNIPIPPVFLYEQDLSRYEVMDGQQRLNAVSDFLSNGYALTGLERWKELAGLRFKDLPEMLRRGLDRRRISANVLVVESSFTDEDKKDDIRRLVFERLNTGGQQLNNQELRNCLFSGSLNDLIIELAKDRLFCEIWEIPVHEDNVDSAKNVSRELAENQLYKRMSDCEIVLRYFAFRGSLKGSVKSILDGFMKDNRYLKDQPKEQLAREFRRNLGLAHEIFGEKCFRYQSEKSWKLSWPLYDSVMVALDELHPFADTLVGKRKSVQAELNRAMSDETVQEVVLGKPNTAKAITARIKLVKGAMARGARIRNGK